MTPTQIELHNAHKARLQRIAAAAARVNPKTDKELFAALNTVDQEKVEKPKDKWAEYQIAKNKPLWFSIVRHIKVTRLGGPCIKDIHKATAEVFGVSLQTLLSDYKGFRVTLARQVSIYLAKELTTLSVNRIARATGNRDHSTAGHAIRKVEKLLKSDVEFKKKVEMIRGRFQ